jgi:EthD domain
MYKVLVFLKRKPGMSAEEFKHYYENFHAKLGEQFLAKGHSTRYLRRYLTPVGHPVDGDAIEAEFDCLTEMWFKDEAQWHATAATFSKGEAASLVVEDEKRFMDRSRMRMFTVDECETPVDATMP